MGLFKDRKIFKKNERGQVSILIAIIFQILFVFFAMVINVGLLIHDKINLQNSVDIAAYYGAMKQAEVLNTIAHLNYEIRQIYKLFAWRLWVLSDAGRTFGRDSAIDDVPVSWQDNYTRPMVCIANGLWYDFRQGRHTDACRSPHIQIPPIRPIRLSPIQQLPIYAHLRIWQSQSVRNRDAFADAFRESGTINYRMALKILASYKVAVANRRAVIQQLEKYLVQGPDGSGRDFLDISGTPVSDGVSKVFKKNLTMANRTSLGDESFQFTSSLGGKPFLVPIEVRNFMTYLDMWGAQNTGDPRREAKDIVHRPTDAAQISQGVLQLADAFINPDYSGPMDVTTADAFLREPEPQGNLKSLVGFEKNPWIVAYVHVRAKTKPKMLFSPFTNRTVTLEAEAFAMPFGGRVGPWYRSTWPSGKDFSLGDKIDGLLPPRMNETFPQDFSVDPNYSRFPGDSLGMRSKAARNIALRTLDGSDQSRLPRFEDDGYSDLASAPGDANADPIVKSYNNPGYYMRQLEIAAIAPDIFDALHYSISPFWEKDFLEIGGQSLATTCKGHCSDLGTDRRPGGSTEVFNIEKQIQLANAILGQQYWTLTSIAHIFTSWSQESTTDFLGQGNIPGSIATNRWRKESPGGRSGYSVKIVSKKFLQRSDHALGGEGSALGPILNGPLD